MTGASLPPGLRFPTGAILGTHLIIAGTYLAHSYQSFSIWSLDLTTMIWTRIDAGTTLQTGSWSRGVLWATSPSPKFLIFGNRAGNLVEDYNRRLLSWDHVAYIDLEAFGIYQPPKLLLDVRTQELGLAALEERVLADFEVVCEDGRRIPCSRRTLQERWTWFGEQRKKYLKAARKALDTLPGSSQPSAQEDDDKPDPRLTPRCLHLSEPYPVALALLQYIYSLSLLTPLQHSPPVLSALLLLATTYKMPHLESLVKHAMHSTLGPASSVGVYEVATLCDCQSLQIRALKVVMVRHSFPSLIPFSHISFCSHHHAARRMAPHRKPLQGQVAQRPVEEGVADLVDSPTADSEGNPLTEAEGAVDLLGRQSPVQQGCNAPSTMGAYTCRDRIGLGWRQPRCLDGPLRRITPTIILRQHRLEIEGSECRLCIDGVDLKSRRSKPRLLIDEKLPWIVVDGWRHRKSLSAGRLRTNVHPMITDTTMKTMAGRVPTTRMTSAQHPSLLRRHRPLVHLRHRSLAPLESLGSVRRCRSGGS